MHPIRPGRIASTVTTLMTSEVNESECENKCIKGMKYHKLC